MSPPLPFMAKAVIALACSAFISASTTYFIARDPVQPVLQAQAAPLQISQPQPLLPMPFLDIEEPVQLAAVLRPPEPQVFPQEEKLREPKPMVFAFIPKIEIFPEEEKLREPMPPVPQSHIPPQEELQLWLAKWPLHVEMEPTIELEFSEEPPKPQLAEPKPAVVEYPLPPTPDYNPEWWTRPPNYTALPSGIYSMPRTLAQRAAHPWVTPTPEEERRHREEKKRKTRCQVTVQYMALEGDETREEIGRTVRESCGEKLR